MRFGIFVLGGVTVRNEVDRVAPRRLAWRGGSRHRSWRAHQLRVTVADGTPMCMTTRAISRFLLQAQRQRQQEMMFADESGEEMHCFQETMVITDAKERLMRWNRDAQIEHQIQWGRCLAQAQLTGGTNERSMKSEYGRQSSGDGQGRGVGKTLSFEYPSRRDGREANGGRQQERRDTNEIKHNKIDKKKWTHSYGETRVNGKVVMICWYHSNRPGGCVRKEDCAHDHSRYPEAYKGKPLDKCSTTFQKEVMQKCSGA
jgi:hypothetical protein